MKLCTKCLINKHLSEFYIDHRYKDKVRHRAACKDCTKTQRDKLFSTNPEAKKRHEDNIKRWSQDNREHLNQLQNARNDNNRDKVRSYHKKWQKNRRDNNSDHRLKDNLRRRIRSALNGASKSKSTQELLGCSTSELKHHLQQTAIKNGYTNFDIESYSGKEYNIDHIVPCAAFNLKCSYHQKLCFNYKNLQILTAQENLSKGAKDED